MAGGSDALVGAAPPTVVANAGGYNAGFDTQAITSVTSAVRLQAAMHMAGG